MRRSHVLSAFTLIGAAALAVSGCASGGDASPSESESASSDSIAVVASTNVWGDIAEQIGGDAVEVTSIISDPDQDPHEYEANSRNQLALSKADVVIENGGGYDDFVDTMLSSAKNDDATVLNAVEISGFTAEDVEELNEHVWYDYATVGKVADEIESAFAKQLPSKADDFSANAKTFEGGLSDLESNVEALKQKYEGKGAAITEPVPLYLLENIGLVNKTPDEFSEAVEEGTDVPADVLQETEKLFSDHEVSVLVYNEQTSGPETEAVLKAAQEADVPAVPVQETLPSGKHYADWQQGILDDIDKALSQGA